MCGWILKGLICISGQEGCGSGRLFTYDEPVSLSSVIEKVKALTGLKHGMDIITVVFRMELFIYIDQYSKSGHCSFSPGIRADQDSRHLCRIRIERVSPGQSRFILFRRDGPS